VETFVADTSADAYEKVVDRLLNSPRYGERVATEWLDLARFADSHGYQVDRNRPVWAYRDWVIKAFNENMPYDQFVTWQLAGDLLENPTKEQRLATAFNRLHTQNEEGGIVEEEFRVSYVVDRVNTFGTAFLGATFECARCHDHKYDPITARDTYSLFAFFQNIDEAGQISTFTDNMPVPTLLLSTEEQDEKLAGLKRRIAEEETLQPRLREEARPMFQQWLENKGTLPELPGLLAAFDFETLSGQQLPNLADEGKPGKSAENPKLVPGKNGLSAQMDGENGFTFPGIGAFNVADEFSLGFWIRAHHLAPRTVIIHRSKAPVDAGSRGYELLLEEASRSVRDDHADAAAFAERYRDPAAGRRQGLGARPRVVEAVADRHRHRDPEYGLRHGPFRGGAAQRGRTIPATGRRPRPLPGCWLRATIRGAVRVAPDFAPQSAVAGSTD
jgi:hypothetical protein